MTFYIVTFLTIKHFFFLIIIKVMQKYIEIIPIIQYIKT